jgi:hypothetical protein
MTGLFKHGPPDFSQLGTTAASLRFIAFDLMVNRRDYPPRAEILNGTEVSGSADSGLL